MFKNIHPKCWGNMRKIKNWLPHNCISSREIRKLKVITPKDASSIVIQKKKYWMNLFGLMEEGFGEYLVLLKCWALPLTLLLLPCRCSRQRTSHPKKKTRSCVCGCEVWASFPHWLTSQRRMEVRNIHPSLEKMLNAMSGRRAILRNSEMSWRKSKGWRRTSVIAFAMQIIDTRLAQGSVSRNIE